MSDEFTSTRTETVIGRIADVRVDQRIILAVVLNTQGHIEIRSDQHVLATGSVEAIDALLEMVRRHLAQEKARLHGANN